MDASPARSISTPACGTSEYSQSRERAPRIAWCKWVKNIDVQKGYVIATSTAMEEGELLAKTKEGVMIWISAGEVSVQGRAKQGVRIMNVKAGDEVAAVARIT